MFKSDISLSWNYQKFQNFVFDNPHTFMIWGDIGVGKTTLAIQLVKQKLQDFLKVFFVYTKKELPFALINRVLNNIDKKMTDNLIFWNPETFNQQFEIITNLNLRIHQLFQVFQQNQIGLIVVDEISSLYILELGSEEKNDLLNRKMILQLATLSAIQNEFHIPILYLNSFTTKKEQDSPYGGKIIDFWTYFDIKMDRTPVFTQRKFKCIKNKTLSQIPSEWLWEINESGFN